MTKALYGRKPLQVWLAAALFAVRKHEAAQAAEFAPWFPTRKRLQRVLVVRTRVRRLLAAARADGRDPSQASLEAILADHSEFVEPDLRSYGTALLRFARDHQIR